MPILLKLYYIIEARLIKNAPTYMKEKRDEYKRKYEALIRSFGEITYEHFVKEDKIVWSDAVSSELGYSPEEMGDDGDSWLTRVHPSDLEGVNMEFDAAFKRDKLFDMEYRFRAKSGEYLWFHDRGVMLTNESGALEAVYGVLKNVDKIRRQRRALDEQRQRLAAFMNSATDYFILFDKDLRLIDINAAAEKAFKVSLSGLKGVNLAEIVPSLDAEGKIETYEKIAAGIQDSLFKEIGPISEHGGKYFSVKAFKAGEGMAMILSDITQRKKTELALKNSERLYRALAQKLPKAAVLLFDTNFRYHVVEGEALAEAGYKKEEMEGYTLYDVLKNPEALAQVEPYYAAAINGKSNQFEMRARDKYFLVNFFPYFDEVKNERMGISISLDVTDLRKSQIELKKSEKLYRSLAESSTDFIFIINDELKVEYVNSASGAIFRMPPEKLVGMPLALLFPKENYSSQEYQIKKVFATGKPFSNEVEIKFPGVSLWLSNRLSPIRNDAGEVIAVMGVSRDFTKRKNAEAALQRNEKALKSMMNAISESAAMIDKNGVALMLNDTAAARFKMLPKDIIGKNIYDYLPEPIRKSRKEKIDRVFATGKPAHFEDSRADRYFYNSVYPVYGEGGAVDAVTIFAVDLTHRKRLEDKLRRMSKVFMEATDPIIVSDLDDNIIDLNAEAIKIFAGEKEKMIGNKIFEIAPPDEREEAVRLHRICKQGELVRNVECERVAKDGSKIPVLLTLSALTGENGEIDSIASIYKNISDIKAAEDALEEYNRELRRSNRELQEFAYVASHDLQEPLRGIKSSIQIIQKRAKDKLDEETSEFMDFVSEGAEHMQKLINALLSYSRVQSKGKEFRSFNLGELLAKLKRNMRETLVDAGGELEIIDSLEIVADDMQIYMLLQNLVTNAVKFRSDKPLKIKISAEERDQDILFSVADNGIGIAPEHRERIFQIFKRLHSKKEYDGAGIGLAVCKKIVERHGGAISVESNEDLGSTFVFTLQKLEEKNES